MSSPSARFGAVLAEVRTRRGGAVDDAAALPAVTVPVLAEGGAQLGLSLERRVRLDVVVRVETTIFALAGLANRQGLDLLAEASLA